MSSSLKITACATIGIDTMDLYLAGVQGRGRGWCVDEHLMQGYQTHGGGATWIYI